MSDPDVLGVDDGGEALSEAEERRAARDELLVEHLALGCSYGEAAAMVDCSDRTVARRMADDEFRDRVSRRRGEVVGELTGQLAELGGMAVAALRVALRDEDIGVRLRASQMTLNQLSRFHSQSGLESLSRDILGMLAEQGNGSGLGAGGSVR